MIRLMLGFAAVAAVTGGAVAQPPVERGSYLVNTIMTCDNCHTPNGPPAAIAGKEFSGGLTFDEPPFKVTAPNITPDKETGIGNWTDAQIKTMLRTGKNPQRRAGRAEVMPTGFYPILTARRSRRDRRLSAHAQAGQEQGAGPVYKIALPHQVFPGAEKPMPEADLTDKVKRGFYLATIGALHGVPHAVARPAAPRFRQALGKGGREFPGPWGVSVSRNITSHKTEGHRRLDRRRDQARDHPGQAQGRHAAQAADGLRRTTPR